MRNLFYVSIKNTLHIVCYALVYNLALLLTSCDSHQGEYHSVTDKIMAMSENYKEITSISSDRFTDHLRTIQVKEGAFTFLVPDRKGEIRSFACTSCHIKPLPKAKHERELKKAHWNILLQHATPDNMNCATCHSVRGNMDELKGLTGKKIDFNHSYKLCSQCHPKQFADWKGGAHGKQIGSWAKPRVSLTCVNCHNPHQPKITSRWPSRFNTKKEKER